MATTTDLVPLQGQVVDTIDTPDHEHDEQHDAEQPPEREPEPTQMSFNVGGAKPDGSSVKATIDMRIDRELRKGSGVRIAVTNLHGELLAAMDATVVAVTFEDEYKDGFRVATERVHKLKFV